MWAIQGDGIKATQVLSPPSLGIIRLRLRSYLGPDFKLIPESPAPLSRTQ